MKRISLIILSFFCILFSSCHDEDETMTTYLRYCFSAVQQMNIQLKDRNGKLFDLHVNKELVINIGNVPSGFTAFCRGGFDSNTNSAKGVISIELSDNNIDYYPVKMLQINQKSNKTTWDFIEYTVP